MLAVREGRWSANCWRRVLPSTWCTGCPCNDAVRGALVCALQDIPMRRMAQPARVADEVMLLPGPKAPYVTAGGTYWPSSRAMGVLGASPSAPVPLHH